MGSKQWNKDNPCLLCDFHIINGGLSSGMECELDQDYKEVESKEDCPYFVDFTEL